MVQSVTKLIWVITATIVFIKMGLKSAGVNPMSNKEARGKKEHLELRRAQNKTAEGIVQLNAKFNRFLNLKWYQRLFIRFDDPRLYSDAKVRRGKR